MVPHVARLGTHQRRSKFQSIPPKNTFAAKSTNSGLMHRNKIRPIRHLVAAAEHRMRYHRIDRDRGFESRRQACRRLVERGFLAGEAEPSRAVSARLTV